LNCLDRIHRKYKWHSEIAWEKRSANSVIELGRLHLIRSWYSEVELRCATSIRQAHLLEITRFVPKKSPSHEPRFLFTTFTPIVSGISAALLVLAIVWRLDYTASLQHRAQEREAVIRKLAVIRGAAETAVNKRVYLTLGLKAHVSVNPDISEQEFADFASLLIMEAEGIRSVTLIKANIISDVYPRAGNEGAIGLDLLNHPDQRVAAEHAIKSRKPWLAGPIKLVQGGEAFINRAPVYTTIPGEEPGGGDYWGMVSILIDKETLVAEIMDSVPDDLAIAIRGRDDRGNIGGYFLSTSTIQDNDPISSEISLPTGGWQLDGAPQAGWSQSPPSALNRRCFGGLSALMCGALVYTVVRATAKHRIYSQQLEATNNELQITHQCLTVANASLAQSNQELEQFAYVASHDLQEPLRKVSSFCELLENEYGDQLEGDATLYMEFIVNGAERMRSLIRDLLAFSRVNSQCSQLVKLDSGQALEEAIFNLEVAIDESAAVITHDELPTMRGNLVMLTQLFQNLIGNGIKYRSDRSPRIHVGVRDDEECWVFSVIDNGIGISPQFHDRVFGIFKRLHGRTEYPGTGVGLAICKRIVDRLQGTIWVESTEGEGATFSFSIPKT
jgi:signal transduction histidine kinase